ncbi:TIGR02301 family protein [Aureimonas leprariae]|nr:TIGR02301 family protein [Aureimonas leprariae]
MNRVRQFAIGSLVAALALAATVGAPAAQTGAKSRKEEAAKAQEAPPPPVNPSNAPFMKPLGRLATILGSVSFLRQLCGDENAGVWRERMNDLLRVQAPNAADKEILIASYNSGYRSFASVYRRCTPAARVAVGRYQDEGASLSRDIATRYGN